MKQLRINTVRIKFEKFHSSTEKAILVTISGRDFWLPIKCCYGLVINKKLGGHVAIPAWLYKEKTGFDPPEELAEETTERHIPERILPQKVHVHASLIKSTESKD